MKRIIHVVVRNRQPHRHFISVITGIKLRKLPEVNFQLTSILPKFLQCKKSSIIDQEALEMKVLEKITEISSLWKESMNMDTIMHHNSNLLQISHRIHDIVDTSSNNYNISSALDAIETELNLIPDEIVTHMNQLFKLSEDSSDRDILHSQINAAFRINIVKEQIKVIRKLLNENDLNASSISPVALSKLIDACLFGSASERIAEYLSLYSPIMNSYLVQTAFCSYLDVEVAIMSKLMLELESSPKTYKKIIPKFTRSYLLDRFEANVKARCVFAWSDPLSTGFKPVADDRELPRADIIKGRHLFFKEAEEVSKRYIVDLTSDRRLYYHDRKEFRETMMMGAAFFIGTCLIDWYVCVM